MRVILSASVAALAVIAIGPATAMPGGGSGGSSGGSAPSISGPSFDAAAEYTKGLDALKAQRFADAKKAFKRVLEVSNDANVFLLAGLADAGLNDLKGARRNYERAVKADRKMVAAHQELAITYAKMGDRAKAEATLAKIREMDGACAGACPDAQKLKDAIAAVEAALASPQARLETGAPLLFASAEAGDSAYLDAVGLINEGRYEAAIASLETARTAF